VSPFIYAMGWIIIYPLFLSLFTVFEGIIYFIGKELLLVKRYMIFWKFLNYFQKYCHGYRFS